MRIYRTLYKVSLFVLVLCVSAAALSQVKISALEPLHFQGEETPPLIYEADLRLNLGQSGTIELWIAMPQQIAEDVTVLAHGDGKRTNFQITVLQSRKTIRFQNDRNTLDAEFDLTDGEYHHLAFVTNAASTQIIGDGVSLGFSENMPYAHPMTGDGLPFYIGGYVADSPFVGYLNTVRLWGRPLSIAELKEAKKYYDIPPETHPAYDYLTAYSLFSEAVNTLMYTKPKISTMTVGSQQGIDFYVPQENGYYIRKIYTKAEANGISDLVLELEKQERDSVPVIRPLIGKTATQVSRIGHQAEQARLKMIAFRHLPSTNLNPTNLNAAIRQYNKLVSQIRKFRWEEHGYKSLSLDDGERLIGIAGTHNGETIMSLRFRTTKRLSDFFELLPKGNSNNDLYTNRGLDVARLKRGPFSFYLHLPELSQFKGIVGRLGDGALNAIGIALAPPATPEQSKLDAFIGKRWISPTTAPVGKDKRPRAGKDGPHGNYTSQRVHTLRRFPESDRLMYIDDMGRGFWYVSNPKEAQSGAAILVPVPGVKNIYEVNGEILGSILPPVRGVRIAIGEERILNYTGYLYPVKPYEVGDPEQKLPWGATFSLRERPTLVKANFHGYNILKMDPRDYQSDAETARLVFKYPDEASRAYRTTDDKIIVPHGFYLFFENEGREMNQTVEIANSQAHRDFHKEGLGFNVGGAFKSFSASVGYKQETSTMDKRSKSHNSKWVVARTTQIRYALVADFARIELSNEFREFVLRLRRDHFAGMSHPAVDQFFNRFGTHYPYAVTYGGTASLEIEYTKAAQDILKEKSKTEEMHASIGLPFLTASASKSSQDDMSDEFGIELSQQSIRFSTIGGSISSGEGWSVPVGEEAPILLDLRPIYELLSPLFFEDPFIWVELRARVKASFNAYLAN